MLIKISMIILNHNKAKDQNIMKNILQNLKDFSIIILAANKGILQDFKK